MLGWLQPDSILHGLSPQIHPKTSQSSSDIPKYHLDTPKHLSRHPKTTPGNTDTNRHHQTYSNTPRRLSVTPQKSSDTNQTLPNTPWCPKVSGTAGEIYSSRHRCVWGWQGVCEVVLGRSSGVKGRQGVPLCQHVFRGV